MIDEHLSDVEHVRKRPGMYIGDTNFFGFIHYLVAAVNFFLYRKPDRIDVAIEEAGFAVSSDVNVPRALAAKVGESPFEKFHRETDDFDGVIVNSLSRCLEVSSRSQGTTQRLAFEQGERKICIDNVCDDNDAGTTMRFQPDDTIFQVRHFSSYNFRSYLKRISYLHPSIRFSLRDHEELFNFHSPGGIADLFDTVATPCQILHRPIHVLREADDWKLEAVWAFHSWRSDSGFSFVNNGRAAEGGTHEIGRAAAFDQLAKSLHCPIDRGGKRLNGIVYALSLTYPKVIWQGCVKEHISNPELKSLVCDALVQGSNEWIAEHPEVAAEIPEIRTFNFPDIWLRK